MCKKPFVRKHPVWKRVVRKLLLAAFSVVTFCEETISKKLRILSQRKIQFFLHFANCFWLMNQLKQFFKTIYWNNFTNGFENPISLVIAKFYWIYNLGVRYFPKFTFPKGNFPSINFPSGNFPKIRLGPLWRRRLQWGQSDAARRGPSADLGLSAASRTDLGSSRLGQCLWERT